MLECVLMYVEVYTELWVNIEHVFNVYIAFVCYLNE